MVSFHCSAIGAGHDNMFGPIMPHSDPACSPWYKNGTTGLANSSIDLTWQLCPCPLRNPPSAEHLLSS